MDIWRTRKEALTDLDSQLKQEKNLVEEVFALVDTCVEQFYTYAASENDTFAIVCCHTLIKARRYAQGCYSICLDGLSQEAGALFRPLLETWEQVIYYCQDPSRTEEAVQGRLPSAGIIGARIGSEYQGLRDHLNWNASHFSFREESLQSMVNEYQRERLRADMRILFFTMMSLLFDAAKCLEIIHSLDQGLAIRIEVCRENGYAIFPTQEDQA